MTTARNVVVTGSTRGIGFGLAEAFLAAGCHVTINGRTAAGVAEAVDRLATKHPRERILGHACDVSSYAALRHLFTTAAARTGSVDVWINNAGAGATQQPFAQQTPEEAAAIISANLLGTVLGTRAAIEGMKAQPGGGKIFNFEGFCSDGRMKRVGMAVYGATKTATRYFSESVAKELEGSTVKIGTIVPGVVVTDMLVSQFDGVPRANWERSRRLYNVIGDTVETVAPWLANEVLAAERNNSKVAWISIPKVIGRFLNPKYRNRDLFAGVREPRTLM